MCIRDSDNAPGQLYSVKLDLADFGDGWRLDEVTVWPNVEWKTAEGIGIGSTENEVRAAYPDAETKDLSLIHIFAGLPSRKSPGNVSKAPPASSA